MKKVSWGSLIPRTETETCISESNRSIAKIPALPLGPPTRNGGQCRSPGETRACRASLLEAPWWVCKAPKEGWCHWPPREPGTQALGPLPQQSSQAWCTAPTRSATIIPLSGVARTVVNGTLKTLPFQMLTSKKSGERSHRSGDRKRLAACPVGWR